MPFASCSSQRLHSEPIVAVYLILTKRNHLAADNARPPTRSEPCFLDHAQPYPLFPTMMSGGGVNKAKVDSLTYFGLLSADWNRGGNHETASAYIPLTKTPL